MHRHNYFLTLSAIGIALLLSHAGFGQVVPMTMPTYNYNPQVPMPNTGMFPYGGSGIRLQSLAYRTGSGSYQLLDGSWHKSSKLVFDGERLTVKDSTAGKQRFTSETVQQLVVEQDTFLVVRNLPGRKVAPPKPDFLHSCVNRQGVRLLALYYSSGRPTYFLSRPQVSMQLLPAGKADFKTAMLAIVKDSPGLSMKIASGEMGRDDVVQIVQDYVNSLHN
jgi:hypothetical protein